MTNNSDRDKLGWEVFLLGNMYPADSSDVRQVMQLIDEYTAKQVAKAELAARINELKVLVPTMDVSEYGQWVRTKIVERIAELEKEDI